MSLAGQTTDFFVAADTKFLTRTSGCLRSDSITYRTVTCTCITIQSSSDKVLRKHSLMFRGLLDLITLP